MDFHGYTVYKDGRILSRRNKNKFMKIRKGSGITRPYWRVSLFTTNNKQKSYEIHRLLAILYVPNPDNKPIVDHIDKNTWNNDISNLRWVNHSENRINCKKNKNNTSGYKNICNNKKCYKIFIERNKVKYEKSFSKNIHTLEDVVKFRNIVYKELNIDIDD